MSDVRCKHSGQAASKPHMMNGRLMTMAAMDGSMPSMHAGHEAGMAMSSKSADHQTIKKSSTASICGCGSGCACSGTCAVSCAAAASVRAVAFTSSSHLPAARRESVAISTAHGLDLFRPPSIS